MIKKALHLLVFTALFSGLSSCYLFRAIKYRNFELKSLKDFDSDTLKACSHPFYFIESGVQSPFKSFIDATLDSSNTYSFLVIRNDSILYENYWEGVNGQTLLPTFSVTKSFVSTLIAIAWKEGSIKSLSDPITGYIPELLKRDKAFANITIQHLLDMRSGIRSNENYFQPNSDVLKMGFGSNIWAQIKKLKIEKPPGEFDYISVNTQLLSIILERATGKKTQEYIQEKLWEPLGMESNATWNIDSRKRRMVRAFCCINAITRDYAKLGRLFLNNGRWNGQQLLPEDWVASCSHIDTMVTYDGYRNQWWSNRFSKSFKDSLEALNYIHSTPHCSPTVSVYHRKENKEKGIEAATIYYAYYFRNAYHAEGLLGQFIYVNPEKNLIIIRTGHDWKNKTFRYPDYFIYTLGEKYF